MWVMEALHACLYIAASFGEVSNFREHFIILEIRMVSIATTLISKLLKYFDTNQKKKMVKIEDQFLSSNTKTMTKISKE